MEMVGRAFAWLDGGTEPDPAGPHDPVNADPIVSAHN
jgi:hypothetical protein